MTLRIFVVGTDTAAGKTTVVTHLLHSARLRGLDVLPFKPAAADDPEGPGDPERLLAAVEQPGLSLEDICPLRYAAPLAPGIASDPDPFLDSATVDWRPLRRVERALVHLERLHQPQIVLLEGAGGLHVPMPGGSWQPTWITSLAPSTVLVGRAGLGAINHACLTIRALQQLDRAPFGMILVETAPPDPSNRLNAAVISRVTGVPHIATLPHRAPPPTRAIDPLAAFWEYVPT